jgi:hypothetical protein
MARMRRRRAEAGAWREEGEGSELWNGGGRKVRWNVGWHARNGRSLGKRGGADELVMRSNVMVVA